MQGGKSALPI
jgi:hypothetical protein